MNENLIVKRLSSETEIFDMIRLARRYMEETSRFTSLTFDLAKAVHCATLTLTDPDQIIITATLDNKCVGMFWGGLAEQVWCKEKVGRDLILYTHPSYRFEGIGTALINEFEKWISEQEDIKMVYVGCHSGVGEDIYASNMYRGLGYQHGGYELYKQMGGTNVNVKTEG